MPSINLLISLTAAILSSSQMAAANPITRSLLEARFAKNYVDCSTEQQTKLKKDFGDAAQLSRWAYDNINTDNKVWPHYFRTDDAGKADDLARARGWWSAIASNNDPTNLYEFSVRCGKADHPDCKSGTSLAITDAQPQKDDKTPREMLVCPIYFDKKTKQTFQDLNSRKFEKPKRGQDNSWCVENNFGWYEVGGVTMLHEMTHLDVVGKAAGAAERQINDKDNKPWFKTHGSEDVGGLGDNYPSAARKLAQLWQKGNAPDKALKPHENAENMAASALEFYMMDQCQKAGFEIPEIKL